MESVFECAFTPTIKMQANRIRKYSPGRCALLLILGIGVFLYVLPSVIWFGFDMFWTSVFLFSLAYLLYCIFFPEINAYFSVKRFKKDTSGEGIYRIAFGDRIEVWQGNIRMTWEYGEINEVFRLKYTYELKKNKHMALFVDPNGFTKGTFSEFKQFLREKYPDLTIPE